MQPNFRRKHQLHTSAYQQVDLKKFLLCDKSIDKAVYDNVKGFK